MSNEIKDFYTREINNYMSRFDDLNDVDVKIIENGLKEALKINPAIDFVYGTNHMLNEKSGKSERKVELKKIHIYYTYDDTETNVPRVGKITYLVN